MRARAMRLAMAAVTATALVAIVLAGSSAVADRMKLDDRAGDLPRSAGRLDIARVSHGHTRTMRWGETTLSHRIRMHHRWLNRRLTSPHASPTGVDLLAQVSGVRRRGLAITVQVSPDGSLYGEARSFGGDLIGYARVWRSGPRALTIAFPRSLLGEDVNSYRWFVRATDYDGAAGVGCHGTRDPACYDVAPNRGTILHTLRRRD